MHLPSVSWDYSLRFGRTHFSALIILVYVVLFSGQRTAEAGSGGWVTFTNETSTRLSSDPSVGASDPDEKEYAWADLDQDGDIDLVSVRKEEFTTPGRRTAVLFMNENGVLVDRTSLYAADSDVPGDQGFLTPCNNRDVQIVDVNGDGWKDLITVTTISEGQPKHISHPRIYINKGAISGAWQGLRFENSRFPQIMTINSPHAVAPRFCSLAVGDIDGDNDVDLYFGDYDSAGAGGSSPENAADDVNDRLFINNGSGVFTDSLETRMSSAMLLSAFSMAAEIVDMNGDGVLDVIKDSALNTPQRVSISYNNPANEGFFNALDVVYANAPYHTTVGELNNDGRPDMVITDDGADGYMLNTGNGVDGRADFETKVFSYETGGDDGFGGDSHIADLNNDGFNDVVVADVDIDIPGCDRRMHLYRNLGNVPSITLQEQGGAAPWTPTGVHDVALFDINQDGWTDMVIGTCEGTEVWMNVPPVSLTFSYPDGLPGQLVPNQATSFRVSITGSGSTPIPGSGKQYVSIDGGPFVQSTMTQQMPNVYFVNIPAVPCTAVVRYYVSTDVMGGGTHTDPSGAPTNFYTTTSTLGIQVIFDDKFETAVAGWTVTNDPSVTGGAWARVNPVGTFFPTGGTTAAQPENDFGQATDQTMCYITQQSSDAVANNDDVDGGPTILTSPAIDLSGADAIISYARWAFWSAAGAQDSLITQVSNNGSSWFTVSSVSDTGSQWLTHSFKVSDFVAPTANVRVRFVASDNPNDSVLEAGIDNFLVSKLLCPATCNNNAECDDGVFCNGPEQCVSNACQSGTNPCSNFCVEASDSCVDCIVNGDCDDGQFCNGVETCVAGACAPSSDPCIPQGLVCNEVDNVCTGCSSDANCQDGLFCNGAEVCAGGVCVGAGNGVTNGGFNGATGWASNIPVAGSITFNNNLSTVGADAGAGGFTWASQSGVLLSGGNLQFTLVSYTGADADAWDYPVIGIDNTFFGLNADGTLGGPTTGLNSEGGTIDNANPATNVTFIVDVEALAGPGTHVIGLGVVSVDGQFGPGTAVYDNVLPAAGSSDPCPGQLCNEANNTCVECLVNEDCVDLLYCNGTETCVNGACQAGSDPCGEAACDENTDTCIECNNNADCNDGAYCNGSEVCVANQCEEGVRPCTDALYCDEVTDSCSLLLQPRTGDPVRNLTSDELNRFDEGHVQFGTLLTVIDGLGPIFNQRACANCHSHGGDGGSGAIAVIRFGLEEKGGFDPLASLGGSLLQSQAISGGCAEEIPEIANVTALRMTTSTFGAGMVEAIPDEKLTEAQNNPPASVSGRAHMVTPVEDPLGGTRVGRFGWKAQVATVLTFSGDASLNEMGLTNRLFEEENAPNGDAGLLATCDTVPDPEDGPDSEGFHFIDRVTDFQRFLSPPPQTPKSGMAGETIFNNIGCVQCHIARFVTGTADETGLANQVIKPYSDYLLHDMGQLGDGIAQGDAMQTEIRTPALWGLRVRNPMMHDGRVIGGTFASRIDQAIAHHGVTGSEAIPAATAYNGLTQPEKDQLVAFLDSLGRAEFDFDGDNLVNVPDFNAFKACYDAAGLYSPNHACAIGDIDQDGATDLADFDFFLQAYDEPLADCNENSVVDLLDILVGTESDVNADAIPDSCLLCSIAATCVDSSVCTCDRCSGGFCESLPALYGNTDCQGGVGLDDILCAINGFNTFDMCPNADVAGTATEPCTPNSIINLDDLLKVLNAFSGANPCGCAPP